MSRSRYVASQGWPARTHRIRLSPRALAICLWLTMACGGAISQTTPTPNGSDAAPPADQADRSEKPVPAAAPASPPDLPDKLPGEALPGAGLLPSPLPHSDRMPGLEPIEELKAKAAKQKKAEEEMAEEADAARRAAAAGDVAEVPRRGSAMNEALGTGDAILGGFNNPQGASPFLPSGVARGEPFQFGWGKVSLHAGAGVSAGRVSGTRTGGTEESVLGFVQGGIAVSAGNRDLGVSSSVYQAKPGSHIFTSLAYDFGYGFPDAGGNGTGFGSGQSAGLDQRFSFAGNFVLPGLRRLVFGVGLNFASVSGINRDFGAETDRYFATASFLANYELSRKTSIEVEFALPFRDFTEGIGSRGVISTISGRTWITPRLRLGVGYTLGKLSVAESSDQTYQQGLVLANYQPTRFLNFNGTAGIEFRNTGDSTITTPVFGLSAGWNSTRGSMVSVSAQRRIFNSALAADTDFTSTSFVVTFGQRFWDRLSGSLSVGYEMAAYKSGANDAGAGQRKDNLLTCALGLTLPITEHLGCSLNYSFGKNASNVSPFRSSQATFQATYAF